MEISKTKQNKTNETASRLGFQQWSRLYTLFWGGGSNYPKSRITSTPPATFFMAERRRSEVEEFAPLWFEGGVAEIGKSSRNHRRTMLGFWMTNPRIQKKFMTQQQDISGDSVPLFVFLRFLNCHQLFVGCSSIHPGFQSQTLTSDELQPVVIRLQVMGWWEWWEIVE